MCVCVCVRVCVCVCVRVCVVSVHVNDTQGGSTSLPSHAHPDVVRGVWFALRVGQLQHFQVPPFLQHPPKLRLLKHLRQPHLAPQGREVQLWGGGGGGGGDGWVNGRVYDNSKTQDKNPVINN